MKSQKVAVSLTPSQFEAIAHIMKSALQNDGIYDAESMSISEVIAAWKQQRAGYVPKWSREGMLRKTTHKERRAAAIETRDYIDATVGILKALNSAEPVLGRENAIAALAEPFIHFVYRPVFRRSIARWQKNPKDPRVIRALEALRRAA